MPLGLEDVLANLARSSNKRRLPTVAVASLALMKGSAWILQRDPKSRLLSALLFLFRWGGGG